MSNGAADIRKVGVIGAGTMGGGIAQVFALHGYHVILVDRTPGILEAALEKVRERTDPERWEGVRGLVETSVDIGSVSDCGLVIEAVVEDAAVKGSVFKALSGVCGAGAIIATNTSSLSVDALSAGVSDPSRFLGMHFMNPPKVMKLVEVVRGGKTSEETVRAVVEVAERLGKVAAVVTDTPGFVSNRLLFSLIGEALRLLEAGVASREAIDTVMRHGMNHPMGPIELADFIGLDVCREIMLNIYKGLGDERYRPTARLESLVSRGKLGRKTGEGFYVYGKG